MNLKTKQHPLQLFDLYQNWDEEGFGHLLFIKKMNDYQSVSLQWKALQQGLISQPNAVALPSIRPARPKKEEGHTEALQSLAAVQELILLLRTDFIALRKPEVHAMLMDKLEKVGRFCKEARR